jgi:hypothetical protein
VRYPLQIGDPPRARCRSHTEKGLQAAGPSSSSIVVRRCLFPLGHAAVAVLIPLLWLRLGRVWEFIRSQPGLWIDGHNIFLYHHPTRPGAAIPCDFGVEVTRTFEAAGEVHATEPRQARLPLPSIADLTHA